MTILTHSPYPFSLILLAMHIYGKGEDDKTYIEPDGQ